MKRAVTSSVLILVVLVAAAAVYFIFRRLQGDTGGDPRDAVPADAAFYFSIRPEDRMARPSPWWMALRSQGRFAETAAFLDRLDSLAAAHAPLRDALARQPLYVAVCPTKSDDFDALFLMPWPHPDGGGELFERIRPLAPAEPQRRFYEGTELVEVPAGGGRLFTFAVSKNVFIGSFTSFLVEDAIRQQQYYAGPVGGIRKLKSALGEKETARRPAAAA